jgi:hypothetical protein
MSDEGLTVVLVYIAMVEVIALHIEVIFLCLQP